MRIAFSMSLSMTLTSISFTDIAPFVPAERQRPVDIPPDIRINDDVKDLIQNHLRICKRNLEMAFSPDSCSPISFPCLRETKCHESKAGCIRRSVQTAAGHIFRSIPLQFA
jgi:hypothetical protein